MYKPTTEQVLDYWRKIMAQAGHGLMIKYGLPKAPSDSDIALWVAKVNELKGRGSTSEAAGREAARLTFVGFETHVYASEADDIESLLDAAGDR